MALEVSDDGLRIVHVTHCIEHLVFWHLVFGAAVV